MILGGGDLLMVSSNIKIKQRSTHTHTYIYIYIYIYIYTHTTPQTHTCTYIQRTKLIYLVSCVSMIYIYI